MGDAGYEPDHDRQRELLGHVEGLGHHVVALLLVAGLEAGNQRELREVPAVLLVLAGVHARVVGDGEDQAAVGSGDGASS